jgi:hypothetical protein
VGVRLNTLTKHTFFKTAIQLQALQPQRRNPGTFLGCSGDGISVETPAPFLASLGMVGWDGLCGSVGCLGFKLISAKTRAPFIADLVMVGRDRLWVPD